MGSGSATRPDEHPGWLPAPSTACSRDGPTAPRDVVLLGYSMGCLVAYEPGLLRASGIEVPAGDLHGQHRRRSQGTDVKISPTTGCSSTAGHGYGLISPADFPSPQLRALFLPALRLRSRPSTAIPVPSGTPTSSTPEPGGGVHRRQDAHRAVCRALARHLSGSPRHTLSTGALLPQQASRRVVDAVGHPVSPPERVAAVSERRPTFCPASRPRRAVGPAHHFARSPTRNDHRLPRRRRAALASPITMREGHEQVTYADLATLAGGYRDACLARGIRPRQVVVLRRERGIGRPRR